MLIEHQQVLIQELQEPQYSVMLANREYVEIADALNYREPIDNPSPQPLRPRLLTWDVFMDLLEPADILVLYAYNQLSSDLRTSLESNDRTITLAIWRGVKTVMTPATVARVQAAANETELDPNWSAVVYLPSRVQVLGLPRITAREVQEMHHRMSGV